MVKAGGPAGDIIQNGGIDMASFEDWKASARRVALDDTDRAQHILDVFEEGIPGKEVILFGDEESWILVVPKADGETYRIETARDSEEVVSFDEAARLLWERHAKYEQDDALVLS